MVGHEIRDACADEGKLDDEGIEKWRGRLDQVAQDVVTIFFAHLFRLFGSVQSTQKIVTAGDTPVRMTNCRALCKGVIDDYCYLSVKSQI